MKYYKNNIVENICPHCKILMEERSHKSITPKLLKQVCYYSKWYYCPRCARVYNYDKYRIFTYDIKNGAKINQNNIKIMTNQPTGGSITSIPPETNEYPLLNFKRNEETDTQETQLIKFYKLNHDGTYENGTTLEELLRVAITRLKDLNMRFPSRENAIATTKMEEALMWLNERTRERKERGVEGKHLL